MGSTRRCSKLLCGFAANAKAAKSPARRSVQAPSRSLLDRTRWCQVRSPDSSGGAGRAWMHKCKDLCDHPRSLASLRCALPAIFGRLSTAVDPFWPRKDSFGCLFLSLAARAWTSADVRHSRSLPTCLRCALRGSHCAEAARRRTAWPAGPTRDNLCAPFCRGLASQKAPPMTLESQTSFDVLFSELAWC